MALKADAREERREMIVIVLRVLLQRMVVALSAADACAEERLRNRGNHFGTMRVIVFANRDDKVADGGFVGRIATGGQHVAGQFIPRSIGRHLLAQPNVEGAHALGAAHIMVALLAILKQVAQLQRPVIDKFRTIEQAIDEPSAAIGPFVREKRPHFGRRRQHADGIEEGAAQELGIAAQVRRFDAQNTELIEHMLIDKIVTRCQARRIDGLLERSGEDDDGDESLEANADGRLTVATNTHETIGVNLGHAGIVGVELAQPSHIAPLAVAVLGAHEELLLLSRPQGAVAGQDDELAHFGIGLFWPWNACVEPGEQYLMRPAANGEQNAPFMGSEAERLAEKQTIFRHGGADAPALELACQPLEIVLGSVAAQRKPETILPRTLAMTRTLIAPPPREKWHNIVEERRRASC